MRNPESTVGKIIDSSKVCYLSSVDCDGYPNTKAVLTIKEREGLRVHWFSTNTSSLRVGQFRANPKACLYFCDRRFYRGAMLRGTIEVCEDAATKERFWKPGDKMYYPLGVTDPDYCILKFTALDGRWYSSFKSENFEV